MYNLDLTLLNKLPNKCYMIVYLMEMSLYTILVQFIILTYRFHNSADPACVQECQVNVTMLYLFPYPISSGQVF